MEVGYAKGAVWDFLCPLVIEVASNPDFLVTGECHKQGS